MSLEADREQLFATIRQLERRRDKLKREYSQKKTKAMQDRLRGLVLLIHDNYDTLRLMEQSDNPCIRFAHKDFNVDEWG